MLTDFLKNFAAHKTITVTVDGKPIHQCSNYKDFGFSTNLFRVRETRYPVDWRTLVQKREKVYQVSTDSNNLEIRFH